MSLMLGKREDLALPVRAMGGAGAPSGQSLRYNDKGENYFTNAFRGARKAGVVCGIPPWSQALLVIP